MATDHPLQRALAAEIRAEMSRRDLTHAQLAEAAGISPSAYRHYLRTFERDLPMRALFAIANVLGVPASELMFAAEGHLDDYSDGKP